MPHAIPRRAGIRGAGTLGAIGSIVIVLALYLGAEWLVGYQVKQTLTDMLENEFSSGMEIQSVGLDGWLLGSRRSGEALAVLPSGQVTPIRFSMVGNPITGATITIESEERLRLMLRRWLDMLP